MRFWTHSARKCLHVTVREISNSCCTSPELQATTAHKFTLNVLVDQLISLWVQQEAQLHGEIDLRKHVDRLVANERHRPLRWHVKCISHRGTVSLSHREKEAGGLGEEALQEELLDSYMDG